MAGPKAPKDPERKRPYFYIMKDKDIYGSVQEDGSIIHFIYESDGRLINSAQIAGNIENKEELGLLETVEGFGRLVHSIGVSVETDNQNEQIEFVFQMYGKQPDIVVIEFAVNDEGDETKGDCYESLVRKVLNLPWKPAVILLFSVFANDWNLQDRLSPVGKLYDLPMVSVLDAVSPQFALKNDEGRVITKNQFFYDMFHPGNAGHSVMADCIEYLFEKIDQAGHASLNAFELGLTEEKILQEKLNLAPVIGNSFENIRLLDKKDIYAKAYIDEGGFDSTDTQLQSVEMDDQLSLTPEFPYNWMYDGTKNTLNRVKAYFELEMECRALLLVFKDSGEVNVGKAKVYVDGEYHFTADPHINNWQHCNAAIIFNNKTSENHVVRIEIAEEDRDKQFTILGFGYIL